MSASSSSEDEAPLSELVKMYKRTPKLGVSVTPFREAVRGGEATITVAVKMNPNKSINEANVMPCKRSADGRSVKRDRQYKVGERVFATISDCKMFFICGKHKDFVSPCVITSQVGSYPLIYEQWQLVNSHEKASWDKGSSKLWFRCRRHRPSRPKTPKTCMQY